MPHHGDASYTDIEFFKRVRARYYVFSGIEPSREVFDALLEAKKSWDDKDMGKLSFPHLFLARNYIFKSNNSSTGLRVQIMFRNQMLAVIYRTGRIIKKNSQTSLMCKVNNQIAGMANVFAPCYSCLTYMTVIKLGSLRCENTLDSITFVLNYG